MPLLAALDQESTTRKRARVDKEPQRDKGKAPATEDDLVARAMRSFMISMLGDVRREVETAANPEQLNSLPDRIARVSSYAAGMGFDLSWLHTALDDLLSVGEDWADSLRASQPRFPQEAIADGRRRIEERENRVPAQQAEESEFDEQIRQVDADLAEARAHREEIQLRRDRLYAEYLKAQSELDSQDAGIRLAEEQRQGLVDAREDVPRRERELAEEIRQLKEDTDRLEREGLVDPNAEQAAMDATAAVMSLKEPKSLDEALRNLRNP